LVPVSVRVTLPLVGPRAGDTCVSVGGPGGFIMFIEPPSQLAEAKANPKAVVAPIHMACRSLIIADLLISSLWGKAASLGRNGTA
jgi:hypothetical protein